MQSFIHLDALFEVEQCRIICTNFDCDFLETWFLRHLLSSTEPHFVVSTQNGLNFHILNLDNKLYTVDRAVFFNVLSVFEKRALNVHRRLRFRISFL